MSNVLTNRRGGSILQVVILTTAISILISVLLSTQYRVPPPHKIQALANARSALIKELQKPIKAQDTTLEKEPLWQSEKYGDALVEKLPNPFSLTYRVTGYTKNDTVRITAQSGAKKVLGDTTLILLNKDPLEGKDLVSGELLQLDSTELPQGFRIDQWALSESKKATDSLFVALDTLQVGPTVNIFQSSDFEAMGDEVGGDLFLDGSSLKLNASGDTIKVAGDLQLTGSVELSQGVFIIGGEVRINDQCRVENATLFIKGNLFLSHESTLSSNIITYGVIEILDNATVDKKPLLISLKKKGKKPVVYIRDNSRVKASIFTRGTIATFDGTESEGIFYTQSTILHKGYHSGLFVAGKLGEGSSEKKESEKSKSTDTPNNTQSTNTKDTLAAPNTIEGTLTDIFEKTEYPLPWFIGNKSITSWREQS